MIKTPIPHEVEPSKSLDFYTTFKEALIRGMQISLNLEESELDGMVVYEENSDSWEIILYEKAEGGTGAIKALLEPSRFKEIITRSRELLHEFEDIGCNSACYECLLSFYNQREHALLDRNMVLPIFKASTIVRSASKFPTFNCTSSLSKIVLMFASFLKVPHWSTSLICPIFFEPMTPTRSWIWNGGSNLPPIVVQVYTIGIIIPK